MPQISRYSDEQVEQLLAELLNILEKHKAPTDLSLMVLGNMVTNLINTSIAPGPTPGNCQLFCPRLTVLYQRRQSALRETDNRLW
ncbi:conserved protein, UPF0352 family [Escherichia coli]|nr:conserved protein, UPF0352 family [Escherichia coli]